jgi:hypothetical protein
MHDLFFLDSKSKNIFLLYSKKQKDINTLGKKTLFFYLKGNLVILLFKIFLKIYTLPNNFLMTIKLEKRSNYLPPPQKKKKKKAPLFFNEGRKGNFKMSMVFFFWSWYTMLISFSI